MADNKTLTVAVSQSGRRMLDIKETAHTLSISDKSVRRLVRRGLLTPNRNLGKLLFPVSEINRFVASSL